MRSVATGFTFLSVRRLARKREHEYLKRPHKCYFSKTDNQRSLCVAFEGGITGGVKALLINSDMRREMMDIVRNKEQILLYDATGVFTI